MNRGKQICELLKSIRKDIAESYSLDYTPAECGFEGECAGFCKKCDAEIIDLERQLNSKYHFEMNLIHRDFSDYVSQRCFSLVETIRNFDRNNQIQGMVCPFEPVFEKPETKRSVPDKEKDDNLKVNNSNIEEDVLSKLKKKLCKDNFANCTVKADEENKFEDYENKFEEIAKILLNEVAIRKGNKKYYIKEIEFYLYDDRHRDIITYPRTCEAGQWFFHPSGVDISFESHVNTLDDEYGLFRPVLDKDAFFGGVLIRQIYPAGKGPEDTKKCHLDGPHKVEWELFDQFDAFNGVKDFPYLESCKHEFKIEQASERVNILSKGKTEEWKVGDILKYNYTASDIPENDLVTSFKYFKGAKYRFTDDKRPRN